MEVDGSCLFYEAASRKLHVWMKDAGVMESIDLSKTDLKPERWVMDSYGNVWVVSGNVLQYVEKTGKLGNRHVLAGEVADLTWDPKNIYLIYKGAEVFVEKRDLGKGNVVWAYGAKPTTETSRIFNRLAVSSEGTTVIANGKSFPTILLDSQGKLQGQTFFTFNDRDEAPPDLALGTADRGPIMFWGSTKSVAFMAIASSQMPKAQMSGMLLAKLDFTKGSVEFLPTGLTEDYSLIGLTDKEAYFVSAKGGLGFAPIR